MLSLLLYVSVFACFLTENEAVDVEILRPIKTVGDEIGLIFIPDNFMDGEHYKETAHAIQVASGFRVWVALTKGYPGRVVNPIDLEKAIQKATDALSNAGMMSSTYVGVAHGIAGFFLQAYAREDESMKAIIFLGSSLDRDVRPKDYPVPTLTLAAELDGITRVTRLAHEYGKLKEDLKQNFYVLYSHPIIVIDGANHRQFASGSMHKKIKDEDLEAEISENQAHRAIAEHVSIFLVATFSRALDDKDIAFLELEEGFFDAEKTFQPFLDIRDLDRKDDVSQWTILAQERFAEELANQVLITNKILPRWTFYNIVDPEVKAGREKVTVETTSVIDDDDKEFDVQPDPEGPIEIAMKLNTKEVIWDALDKIAAHNNQTNTTRPLKPFKFRIPTCKSLNEFAIEIALKQSSPVAQQRYQTRGRKIFLKDDRQEVAYFFWTLTPLEAMERLDGLHIRSNAFLNTYKGEHYCKVLTPFRAMEWINIDALKKA